MLAKTDTHKISNDSPFAEAPSLASSTEVQASYYKLLRTLDRFFSDDMTALWEARELARTDAADILLTGSAARGEHLFGSDLDAIVVCNRMDRWKWSCFAAGLKTCTPRINLLVYHDDPRHNPTHSLPFWFHLTSALDGNHGRQTPIVKDFFEAHLTYLKSMSPDRLTMWRNAELDTFLNDVDVNPAHMHDLKNGYLGLFDAQFVDLIMRQRLVAGIVAGSDLSNSYTALKNQRRTIHFLTLLSSNAKQPPFRDAGQLIKNCRSDMSSEQAKYQAGIFVGLLHSTLSLLGPGVARHRRVRKEHRWKLQHS